jgi:hypothetical protein
MVQIIPNKGLIDSVRLQKKSPAVAGLFLSALRIADGGKLKCQMDVAVF